MKFAGIVETSLIDFPGRIATVLFTPYCNFRCPYCHNWKIVIGKIERWIDEEDVFSFLKERKGFIDGVVITGGEPLLHSSEIFKFARRVKEIGLETKLDTNGSFPELLEEALNIFDFVAMDVKTSLEKYSLLGFHSPEKIRQSINLIKNSKIEYEFRITAAPLIVEEEDIRKIGILLKNAKKVVVQQFVNKNVLDEKFREIAPYPSEKLKEFADILSEFVEEVEIRE